MKYQVANLEEVLFNIGMEQYHGLVLLGDFNVNWLDTNSCIYRQLSYWTLSLGLNQLIKDPTRITSECRSTLDLVFTNRPDSICDIRISEPFSTSDHCKVYFRIRGKPRVDALPPKINYLIS